MMNKPRLFALAIIFAMLSIALSAPLSHAQSNTTGVTIHLSGSSVIGTSRTGTYSATFIDPEARMWDYKVYITSSTNMTGASPLLTSPLNGTLSPENNTFSFEITAQRDPGQLEIHINCTVGTLYYEKVQIIDVVTPISFNIDINNPSNVIVKNATVQFYVDGSEIDKKVVDVINARETTSVSAEWITRDAEPGWHDSKIVVDLNGDGTIDRDAGDMIVEERFYIEGSTDWVFAITVMVGLAALILGLGYISRRKMK